VLVFSDCSPAHESTPSGPGKIKVPSWLSDYLASFLWCKRAVYDYQVTPLSKLLRSFYDFLRLMDPPENNKLNRINIELPSLLLSSKLSTETSND